MTSRGKQRHLTSLEIQGFLDRELTPSDEAAAQEHLAACPLCQKEVESWELLFADLGNLPEISPPSRFAQEVMEGSRIREPQGLGVLPWAASSGEGEEEAHIPSWSLQDYLDGNLAPRPAARVKTHLEGCSSCREDLREWNGLFAAFQPLPRFSPTPGFAERVMDGVMTPAMVPARRAGWSALPGRVRTWARNLFPDTRHGWAVVGGVASAPVITLGALLYLLFSRPALTPGALGSYLLWKGSEILGLLVSMVTTVATQSSVITRFVSALEPLTRSNFLLGLGGLGLSLLSAVALWVLYRNLIATPSDEPYARARM